MDAVRVTVELHDGQDEILRFVEGVQNFVARDGDRRCACDPPFDLDETQPSRAGHAGFDVVAELFGFPVHRLEAQAAFHLHDDCPRAGGVDGRVHGWVEDGWQIPAELPDQPRGNDQHAADDDGWQRREFSLLGEFF